MNEEKKLLAPEEITAKQTRKVLEWLLERGSITTIQAIHELRCTRLSARIWDLRHIGYDISGTICTKTENGETTRWTEYRLEVLPA